MATYILAAYELDQAYGGPEEGGWYYDTGDLRRVLGARKDKEAAYATCRRLNALLGTLQRDHRRVSSVLYGGGRYAVRVYKGHAPSHYPLERPYYE